MKITINEKAKTETKIDLQSLPVGTVVRFGNTMDLIGLVCRNAHDGHSDAFNELLRLDGNCKFELENEPIPNITQILGTAKELIVEEE